MKKLIIAIVIIVILSVGGYLTYSLLKPKTIVDTVESYGIKLTETDIKLLQNEYLLPGHLKDLAVKNSEPRLCAEISETQNAKVACYRDLAVKLSDPNLCDNLQGNNIFACYVEVYQDLAVKNEDSTECEKMRSLGKADIEANVQSCYLYYAENVVDESVCEKSGLYEDLCYKTVALSKPDPTLCEKAGSMKDSCYQNCQYRPACKALL